MTDAVDTIHPALVSYLPRRATVPRLALVATRTSVTIPRIDPSEVGPGPTLRTRSYEAPFATIEGRPFLRVDVNGTTLDDVLARFAEPASGQRGSLLARAIARTPMSAQLPVFGTDGRPSVLHEADHRGVDVATLGPMTVRSDGTEAARARLHAWVAANVRIAGEGVYVDTGGPLVRPARLGGGGADYDVLAFPRLTYAKWRMAEGPTTLSQARAQRAFEVERHHGITHVTPEHYELAEREGMEHADRAGVDTETLYANLAPGLVLDCVSGAFRTREGGVAAEFNGLGLRGLAMRGAIGAIPAADAAQVLEAVATACRYGRGIPAIGRRHGEELSLIQGYIRDTVLPRIAAKADALVAEDADDLSALVP